MEDKDLYAALGVERSATSDEIKKVYRKLARKYHPDVNPGNDQAEAKFKEVSEAHDILGDETKRKLYDEFGMVGMQSGFDADQARAAQQAQHRWQSAGSSRHSGFGGYQNFDDIFGDILGTGAHRGPVAGGDIESSLTIDFLDAVRGLTTEIALEREEACGPCQGSGIDLDNAPVCPECSGTGKVQVGQGPVPFMRACPRCGGAGRAGGAACPTCRGVGRTARRERLSVKIPAGVDTGSRVRIAGKGGAGNGGGRAGDLFIRVSVRPHARIERKGDDLVVDLPIKVSEAIAGAAIEVPTPDGAKVRVKVPPYTQSGAKLRIRGHGMPNLKNKKKGDLFLRVLIHVPQSDGEGVAAAASELDSAYDSDVRAELRF